MRFALAGVMVLLMAALLWIGACATSPSAAPAGSHFGAETAQVPSWSWQDMNFFLHGSMSTEFVPETVLHSFIRIYPDLFPSADLSHLGLIPDPAFGAPVGLSRGRPAHLAGLQSLGVNCAACHVAEIELPAASGGGGGGESGGGAVGERVRVLGVTSHFDVEGFFGAILGATWRTADVANMKRFLAEYLDQSDPVADPAQRGRRQAQFAAAWDRQAEGIAAVIAIDPAGARGAGAGGLQNINRADLQLDGHGLDAGADLARLTQAMLKLFHNMRTAVHVPDAPPEKLPAPSGPGRNDAFGLLSAALLGAAQPAAPVKFGVVWNVAQRRWVHWDGDTRSPLGRNLLAALGLGAPLVGHEGRLDFQLIQRQTDITEHIAAPRYPLAIDGAAARRGAPLYQMSCAACHDGPESERRLHRIQEVGTDPRRAELFTPVQAERFNQFLADLQTPGYTPALQPGLRSTQKYWAANLGGVWARSPYLHNGSVRTMRELLTPPGGRAVTFHRGGRRFDPEALGYTDAGAYLFDTRTEGNSNSGHDYGTGLSAEQKRDLIEYLKTL